MSYIGNPGSNKTLTTNTNGVLQGLTSSVPTGGLYNWDLSGPGPWTNTGTGPNISPQAGTNATVESPGLWYSRKTGIRGYGAGYPSTAHPEIVGMDSAMSPLFDVDLKSSSLTIEMYFQMDTFIGTPYYPIVLNDIGVGSNAIYVNPYVNPNQIQLAIGGSITNYSANMNFPVGRPFHVAVTLDRATPSAVILTTYYDGVIVQSNNLGSLGNFTTNFTQFQAGWSYCCGIVGWMCLRDVALTATQVRANTLTLKGA